MQNKILLVLKYLWDTTDENHTASIADLIQYLSENGCQRDGSPDTLRFLHYSSVQTCHSCKLPD